MRRSLLVLALACTAAFGAWHFARLRAVAQKPPEPSLADRYQLQWEHPSEQRWIIDDIVESILGFGDVPVPPGQHDRATVSIQDDATAPRVAIALASGAKVALTIDHYIWSPSTYTPLAAAALKPVTGATSESAPLPSSLLALTNPLALTIQQENLRISSALQADPRSADAHEEAALVLAALAFREAAGDFSDPRKIMSRMTAHLAIARHVRAAPGVAGRVADAALLTLAGREREAMELIGVLEAGDAPGLRPWLRALRLRNTNDWRSTRNEKSLTLLEQLETLRAILTTLGSDRALDYLNRLSKRAPTTGWARLMLHWSGSVEAGNTFTDAGLGGEVDEARQLRSSFGDAPDLATPEALVTQLNAAPLASAVDPASATIRAIDWGLWASSSQRHVLMQLQSRYRHLNERLGQPAEAQAFAREADVFSGLTTFPLLRLYLSFDAQSHAAAVAAAADVCRRRPDLVPFEVWEYVFQKPSFAAVATETLPPSGPWFTPLLPAGTVFDLGNRAFDDTVRPPQPRLSLSQAQWLRALAPSRRQLAMEIVRLRDGNFPPYTVMQQEYGALTAYDLILARRVARAAAADMTAYVPLMRHVGELNAESLGELGAYLADHGRHAEAQTVYEEWIAKSRDQVEIANGVRWLVRRYHETQQTGKAEALAKRAADVYSYLGLLTLADLLDWRGERDAAHAVYETAARRYDNHNELLAFCLRTVEQEPTLQARIDELLPKIFPRNFERVTAGSLTGEPPDGMTFLEVGESGRRSGLRNHDIVVAVDSIRVHNFNQYRVARGASATADLRFIVWRAGGYLEVAAPLRYSWPVNNVQEYVRGRAAVPTR